MWTRMADFSAPLNPDLADPFHLGQSLADNCVRVIVYIGGRQGV